MLSAKLDLFFAIYIWINYQISKFMNGQVQGLGGSKSRNNLCSPASHNINLNEDSKNYKKKYEETRELLKN